MKKLALELYSTRGAWWPPPDLIFRAFFETPFDDVKVVILGEDPYPNPKHAVGLAFSAPGVVELPDSLKRIFRELNNDPVIRFAHTLRGDGDLMCWAQQGVLLLNTALTRTKRARSHTAVWGPVTDTVIERLNQRQDPIAFLFWGQQAWRKAPLITEPRHFVRLAWHPTGRRGRFSGCRHFSQVNAFLSKERGCTIAWGCVGSGM